MNNSTNIPTEDVVDLGPFRAMVMTIGTLPTAFTESMTYYEALAYFVKYLNHLVEVVDQNAEATKELQKLFVELKEYVDHYFDNLDIQTEIDNKLDDMAESGELAELVAQYLQLGAVIGFQTISDLAAAENLNENTIAKTLGRSNPLTGDGSYYLIREKQESDVPDGYNLVALTNYNALIAERIPNYWSDNLEQNLNQLESQVIKTFDSVSAMTSTVSENGCYRTLGYYTPNDGGGALYFVDSDDTVVNEIDHLTCQDGKYAHLANIGYSEAKQYGAKGDGTHDDYPNLMRAINAHDLTIIPAGVYNVSGTLAFENKTIRGSNYTHLTIKGVMEDDTKPIIACGGASVIDNICVAYDPSLISSNMASGKRVGFQLYGGYRNLQMQQGSITNCQASYCGTGITDGGHSVFSCHFDTIKINNCGRWGFAMTSTARTGNVYTNIYINNHSFISSGNADTIQCNQGFYLTGEESECVIDQLNVEHMTAYQPIWLENVHALHAGSIHLEGVRNIGNYDGYLALSKVYGTIDSVSFYYTRAKTGQSLIKLRDANGTNTSTNLFGGEKCLTFNTIELKGINRPDRGTYGYEPEYPVSASTLAGSLGAGYLIDRESATDKYLVDIRSINWQTFTYGFDDSSIYEDYPKNPHNSIRFKNYGAKQIAYTTAERPTKMLTQGLKIYDSTLHKTLTYYDSNWYDESGTAV